METQKAPEATIRLEDEKAKEKGMEKDRQVKARERQEGVASAGGVLSVGSVGEQMLYEIGDPASYQLPDVTADFSQVSMLQTGEGVMVKGARGRAPGHNYKISATYMDGYKVRENTVICTVQ